VSRFAEAVKPADPCRSGPLGRQASIAVAGGLDPKPQWWECSYLLHCYGDITATDAQSVPLSNGWEVRNWETGT
jgi:hypothetical protein